MKKTEVVNCASSSIFFIVLIFQFFQFSFHRQTGDERMTFPPLSFLLDSSLHFSLIPLSSLLPSYSYALALSSLLHPTIPFRIRKHCYFIKFDKSFVGGSMDGRTDGRKDERTDGRTNKRTDRRTNGQGLLQRCEDALKQGRTYGS